MMPTYAVAKTFTFNPVYVYAYGWFVEGTDYSETLYGSQYDDEIWGYGGHDILYGQGGNDLIYAGEGNDTLIGGAGADRLDGGNGIDTASYASSGAVTVDLRGNAGFGSHAQGDTYFGIENVLGSAYADMLLGNAASNRLDGSAGDDYIDGDVGHDMLIGGSGNDTMVGGQGDDRLRGGAGSDILWGDVPGETIIGATLGNDIFMINLSDRGLDTIGDFQHGYDHILISGFSREAAPLGSDGQLAVGHFGTEGWHGTTLDGTDRLIYLTNTHTLYLINSITIDAGDYSLTLTPLAHTNISLATDDLMFA
jgi:Ca2+-binding RTX toxin-like protein